MKLKTKKRLSSLLLSLLLAVGLTIPAVAAASTVTYTGHNEFEFAPGSSYTETDLFENFKGVMPGDVLTETITVKNEYRGSDYVKVYMAALLHDENDNPISPAVLEELKTDDRKDTLSNLEYMHDFLAQLTLTVWNGTKTDANIIYEGHPNSLDTWTKTNEAGYTYLGKLTYNQSLELTAELSVPLEMGNDYANRIGEVDWVFLFEERDNPGGGDPDPDPDPAPDPDPDPDPNPDPDPDNPTPVDPTDPDPSQPTDPDNPDTPTPTDPTDPDQPDSPKTGDETNIWPYVGLLGVCLLALCWLFLTRKKKTEED